jgi:hypothetical protein
MKITKFNTFILFGGGAFLLYAHSKGWFEGKEPINPVQLSGPRAQDGSTATAPATDPRYKSIADEFRNDLMNGSNFSYDNSEFLKSCDKLLVLNDADLIKVSDNYKVTYRTESYNTLRRLLDSVNLVWWSSYLKKEELENRFDKLNIQ